VLCFAEGVELHQTAEVRKLEGKKHHESREISLWHKQGRQ
jgi:hypothetical protein